MIIVTKRQHTRYISKQVYDTVAEFYEQQADYMFDESWHIVKYENMKEFEDSHGKLENMSQEEIDRDRFGIELLQSGHPAYLVSRGCSDTRWEEGITEHELVNEWLNHDGRSVTIEEQEE
jgi:hypothetical protein